MINLKKEEMDERIIEPSIKGSNQLYLIFIIMCFILSFSFTFLLLNSLKKDKKIEISTMQAEQRMIKNLDKRLSSLKLDNLNRIDELVQKRLDDLKKVSEMPRFQEEKVELIDSQEIISIRQKLREAEKEFTSPFKKNGKYIELLEENNEDNIIDNIVKIKKELKEQKSKLVSISKE